MIFYKIHRTEKTTHIQQAFRVKFKKHAQPANRQNRTEDGSSDHAENNFFLHKKQPAPPFRLLGVFYFNLCVVVNLTAAKVVVKIILNTNRAAIFFCPQF